MKLQLISAVLLTFFLAKTTAAQEPGKNMVQESQKYTMEGCINKFDSTKIIKNTVGYQYWFIAKNFMKDGLTLKMSVVAPQNATHAPHKHAGDETFFVLEGTAKFYLDGKTTTGGAYTSFYCPEGSEHGISNAGDTELKYLVLKKY